MTEAEEWVERFLEAIRADRSTLVVGRSQGISVTVTRYLGHDLEHPTVIHTSPEHFVTYLDLMGPDASGLWDVGPREAAFRLLLVHIDEEFGTLRGNPDLIQIGPKEMFTRRSRPRPPDWTDDLPPGDYEWRAAPPRD